MAKRYTGKNRDAAKFLGIPPENFKDPGFCLGCGESECECDLTDAERCPACYEACENCTCDCDD